MKECTNCGRSDVAFNKKKPTPDGLNTICRECSRKKTKSWKTQIKFEVLSHYSDGKMVCSCCKENIVNFLVLDHVDGGGNVQRRELKKAGHAMGGALFYSYLKSSGYPPGYRVLCHNCNYSMSTYGGCPHQGLIALTFTQSRFGKKLVGSETREAKLSESDIPFIRSRLASGESVRSLAKAFNVSWTTMKSVKVGKTWKHVKLNQSID